MVSKLFSVYCGTKEQLVTYSPEIDKTKSAH